MTGRETAPALRRAAVPAIALAAALLGPALRPAPAAGADPIDREYHESFVVREGDRLVLSHGDGDVRVVPAEGDTLAIEVRYHASVRKIGFGGRADFGAAFVQEGRTVRVNGNEQSAGGFGYFERQVREHVYLISAPAWLELEIEGEDGDVEIEGWRARITCRTDDGDLDLRDVEAPRVELKARDGDLRLEDLRTELNAEVDDGDLVLAGGELTRCRLHAEDGDITVGAAWGSFEIDSLGGDVIVRAVRARKLRIVTDDGDVDLQLRDAGGMDVEIETGEGDVRVELPRGASTAFRLESRDGEVRTDLPAAELSVQEKGRLAGAVGRGEGRLEVRAGDGRIALLQGERAADPPEPEALPPLQGTPNPR